MSDKNPMDIRKVKELIDLMKENELVELEIADGDHKVHLKRPGGQVPVMQQVPMPAAPAAPPAGSAPAPAAEVKDDEGLIDIPAPIVGTFYQAAGADADPYIKVGDKVTPDAVVCIVEAMKVMNEIKAEVSGTVVEICCKDGQAVEYGQALFKVRP